MKWWVFGGKHGAFGEILARRGFGGVRWVKGASSGVIWGYRGPSEVIGEIGLANRVKWWVIGGKYGPMGQILAQRGEFWLMGAHGGISGVIGG